MDFSLKNKNVFWDQTASGRGEKQEEQEQWKQIDKVRWRPISHLLSSFYFFYILVQFIKRFIWNK